MSRNPFLIQHLIEEPIETLEDPDYAPATDDGRQNAITDFFDAMEQAGANELGMVGGFAPTYTIDGFSVPIPNSSEIEISELKEDLKSLGIVHNSHVYTYVYKPLHGSIEAMEFIVNTYEVPGIFSIVLTLAKKTYK